MSDTNDAPQADRIECPASKEPAVRYFIVAGLLLAFGLYCFYDAYILGKYPYPTGEDAENINKLATYYFNHWGAFVFTIGGLIPLVLGLRFLKRVLVADAEGVAPPGGPKVAWSSVTKLDATDLASKGLLRLEYGAEKPLVLDSWCYQNFKALVAFVEAHVPAEARDEQPENAESEQAEE